MRCRLCNKEIDEDSKFCEFCGYEQPDEYHLSTFKAFLKKNDKCVTRILVGIVGSLMYMIPLALFLFFYIRNVFSLGVPLAIAFLLFVYTLSKEVDDQF